MAQPWSDGNNDDVPKLGSACAHALDVIYTAPSNKKTSRHIHVPRPGKILATDTALEAGCDGPVRGLTLIVYENDCKLGFKHVVSPCAG